MADALPSTMHAWRKHMSSIEPAWEEVTVPSAPSTGFLCRMLASGVCHSDRALLDDKQGRPGFQDKYILGHEGCGEIIEIGDQVKDDRFKVGDVISMLAVPGCGASDCAECSRFGVPQVCPRGHHSGIGQDGFYAPYGTIDARGAVLVPAGVSHAEAAVATDAVMTAYHAIIRRAEVKPDETVFLFGLGGLGFNALQVVHKAIGARVIVSDIRQERLDAAAELGIPREDIVPVGKSVQEFVKENRLEGKIDTTLDKWENHRRLKTLSISSDRSIFTYLTWSLVRIAGKVVCIGTLSADNTIHMKLGIRKRLAFIFSYGGQREDLEELLELMAKKVIAPQVETARLEDFPQVLQDLCDGKVKARVALTST